MADTNPEQLKDAPAGVETYGNLDEMLANADINVVMISTPNPSHLEMVEKAAAAGKHIICEKPAAMTVEQFDRIDCDTVIFATGQRPDITPDAGLTLGRGNSITVVNMESDKSTNIPGIFAAGDCIYGTKSVIQAIQSGREAASAGSHAEGCDHRQGAAGRTGHDQRNR